MATIETFGQVLRRIRVAAGYTQAQFADAAGISLRTVQSWEIDRRCPVHEEFWKALSVLGLEAVEQFSQTRQPPEGKRVPHAKGRPAKAASPAVDRGQGKRSPRRKKGNG